MGSYPAKAIDGLTGFNQLLKYDFAQRTAILVNFGDDCKIGEVTFVPRGEAEDDGYLVLFVYLRSLDRSDFLILDALDPKQEIARVKLPVRVPHGLHGSWNPES